MNNKEVVFALRTEVKNDKVFSDVCQMFAERQRSRHQVTVKSLSLRMHYLYGVKHTDNDYRKVLTTLATLGFGRVENDRAGRLRALKDVKTTLNSIGKVAIGKTESLEEQNKSTKNKYVRMTEIATTQPTRTSNKIGLTIMINTKPVSIPLPDDIKPEEMAELIYRLKGADK